MSVFITFWTIFRKIKFWFFAMFSIIYSTFSNSTNFCLELVIGLRSKIWKSMWSINSSSFWHHMQRHFCCSLLIETSNCQAVLLTIAGGQLFWFVWKKCDSKLYAVPKSYVFCQVVTFPGFSIDFLFPNELVLLINPHRQMGSNA